VSSPATLVDSFKVIGLSGKLFLDIFGRVWQVDVQTVIASVDSDYGKAVAGVSPAGKGEETEVARRCTLRARAVGGLNPLAFYNQTRSHFPTC
jgi:hypothetical protein